jgi:hypothetical protein
MAWYGMTLDEALSKTIIGYKARHFGMASGAFIHYDFDGFKINGKPFYWNEEDKAADWYIIDAIAPKDTNWDVGAAIDIVEDDVIFCPSCWEIEPVFIAKPDTVKAGWEMFDRAKRGTG